MVPQVPAREQVHHQVQVVSVLERMHHVHQKPVGKARLLVVDLCQDDLLVHHRVHRLLVDDSGLRAPYFAFDISFKANFSLPFLVSTRHTLPKPPFPMTWMKLNIDLLRPDD